MQNISNLTRQFGKIAWAFFIVLSFCLFSLNAQQTVPQQTPSTTNQPQADKMQMDDEEVEIAHPFFTHRECRNVWVFTVSDSKDHLVASMERQRVILVSILRQG